MSGEARQTAALAACWDEGVEAAFRGAIVRQNADDVKSRNPYRAWVPDEPGMTWNGSYQHAYLRGHADAARGVPVGTDPGDPMPYVSLAPAWAMLAGYVDQAREDDEQIDPTELLTVMREFKASAYKPVHEWWRRILGDHASPWGAA